MFENIFFSSIIGFFVVLTPLIFVHELGHYYAAIKSGVKVEVFSIGFGPELFGFNDKRNTRWKFCLMPLGGYVKMKGELIPSQDNVKNITKDIDTFSQASLLSRFIIVFSGPLANLILGLGLITSIYFFNGRYVSPPIINNVAIEKPAKLSGILPGDKVLYINDNKINNFLDIKTIVESNPKKELDFNILRGDSILSFTIIPDTFYDKRIKKYVGRIGITASPSELQKLSVFEACKLGISDSIKMTFQWLQGLKSLIFLNVDKQDILGPIGIAKISGSSLDKGLFPIIFLMAVLSINLGLINLLPIPALDGGYITLYLYELVFRKPLSTSLQIILLKFGFIFLISLMVLVTAFDLGF